jgi:SAM-dependent methyltransferase
MQRSPEMDQSYADKSQEYYAHARVEIAPLLPSRAPRVLEVGCGQGATLRWLRESNRCIYTAGIELSEHSAQRARACADYVVCGDAEELIASSFVGEKFDLILCLDVLEHMVDPWRFVGLLPPLLHSTGQVIFSIPNVRNLGVVLPLLFRGLWRYREEGILDRTHLRFFTRESALQLASIPPLIVRRWAHNIPKPSRLNLLNKLTFGLAADFLALQFLIAAGPPPEAADQKIDTPGVA